MKNIDTVRAAAADLLRLDLQGGRGNNLSQADFFRLESAMADLVAAVPGDYAADIQAWASRHIAGPNYRRGPETMSLREAASIFGSEFSAQAFRINDSVNPFAEKAQTSRMVIIGGVLLFAAFFFAVSATKAKSVIDSVK